MGFRLAAGAMEFPWPLALVGEDEPAGEIERSLEAEFAADVHQDPDQFLILYERYYERILNFLYRQTGDRETAEDLTSQTFLSAFEHLSAARRHVNFRPWIYTVATNACRSHARRGRRWVQRIPILGRMRLAEAARDATRDIQRDDLAVVARDLLLRLPGKYRDALMLRFDEELSYAEIGEILGVSAVGARTRVLRGLRQLRKRLEGA
jgi:RNA polymerase sigma-70 factor (ECF subfamily)